MLDERAKELAKLVLDYSVEIEEGDRLMIQFDPKYSCYGTLLGDMAKQRGAKIRYDMQSHDPHSLRWFLQRNDMDEWQQELERRKEISRWCTARILVDCDSNPNYAEGIEDSESKVAEFNKRVIGPYKEVLYRPGKRLGCEVKWNIVGFPCKESAEAAGMAENAFANFVYKATLENDWHNMSEKMKDIKQAFDYAKDVHIYVPGQTDLHLNLAGRGGEICDGKLNMPDGEVCYGPVEENVNGKVYFQCPTKRPGLGILQGISLEFRDGIVVNSDAKENPKALEKALQTDEGARMVGELGIGCNYAIKRTILETLFDEKIGGTVHLALGDSFDQPLNEGGGLNRSAIHWDIVCDLRKDESNLSEFPGGELYVNGKLVQKDGKWKI